MKRITIKVGHITHEVVNEIAEFFDLGDDDPSARLCDGTPVYFDLDDTPYIICNGEAELLSPHQEIIFSA